MHDFVHHMRDALSIPLPMTFALTAALMASVGVLLALLNREFALRVQGLLEVVSGLLLLGVTCTHLIGHAVEDGVLRGIFLMATGAFIGGLISHLAGHSHGEEQGAALKGASLASILAIGVHSLLDGGVYAASLGHDHGHMHGAATASIGLVLHEGAEGVIAFFLSYALLRSVIPACLTALFAAAVTTPVGTLAALWAGDVIGPAFLHIAFPIAAGFVGYAGCSLLWPHLRKSLSHLGVWQRRGQG